MTSNDSTPLIVSISSDNTAFVCPSEIRVKQRKVERSKIKKECRHMNPLYQQRRPNAYRDESLYHPSRSAKFGVPTAR